MTCDRILRKTDQMASQIVTGAEKSVVSLMEQFKQDLNVKLEGESHIFIVMGASVSFFDACAAILYSNFFAFLCSRFAYFFATFC